MNKSQLLNGIDFRVNLEPVYGELDGTYQVLPNAFQTVREDTGSHLAVVGSRYRVQQHTENLERVNRAITTVSNDYGVTHKFEGARIYSRFTLNDKMLLARVRKEKSVMAVDVINSYESQRSFQASISIWRLVCTNGAMGFVSEFMLKRRHVKSISLDTMLDKMGELVNLYADSYTNLYKRLSGEKPLAKELVEKTMPKQLTRIAEEVYPLEKQIVGNKDSAWVQYNAFTRSISRMQHVQENRRIELSKSLSQLYLSQYPITS